MQVLKFDGNQVLYPSFSGWLEKQNGCPGLSLAELFVDFFSSTTEQNLMNFDSKQY